MDPLSGLMLVSERVERAVALFPDRTAVCDQQGFMTYRQLDAKAYQVARHLRRLGVGPEQTVGIAMERSADFAAAALGILRAGAAFVPLDRSYPTSRLLFIAEEAELSLIVGKDGADLAKFSSHPTILIDSPDIAKESFLKVDISVSSDQLAYVIFTSGTTGKPKGVEVTHGKLGHLVHWHNSAFSVNADDRASLIANIGFDAAVWELWPYLCAGATLFVPPGETIREPHSLMGWLVDHKITAAFVPTLLAEVLIRSEWPTTTSLRLLLTGGDVLRNYPAAALPFLTINNYGLTECTVVSTSGVVLPDQHPADLPTIGCAIAGTELYVLDDQLTEVPEGSPGELFIGGSGVARGYVNQPLLTAERFLDIATRNGMQRLYRSGDRCRLCGDGSIQFLGRSDEQVQIRGYRVECTEVESALNSLPFVQTSLVVGREDCSVARQLLAYVVTRDNTAVTYEGLRESLRGILPNYMVPAEFVRLDKLPVTENGKLNRNALPMPTEENRVQNAAECDDPLEKELSVILKKLLKISQIERQDNFFLLGGHSFIAAQLIARIRSQFGVELDLKTVFDSPTLAGLSGKIEERILANI